MKSNVNLADVQREQMRLRAWDAKSLAYAPYSNYAVGCCLIDDRNEMHVGCNVENASLSATLCAERSAVAGMVAARGRKISAVVLIASSPAPAFPCGVCLQVLREFGDDSMPVFAFDRTGQQFECRTLAELFPYSFGPADLK